MYKKIKHGLASFSLSQALLFSCLTSILVIPFATKAEVEASGRTNIESPEEKAFKYAFDQITRIDANSFISYKEIIELGVNLSNIRGGADKEETVRKYMALSPEELFRHFRCEERFADVVRSSIEEKEERALDYFRVRIALERLQSVVYATSYPYEYLKNATFYTLLRIVRDFIIKYREEILLIVKKDVLINKMLAFLEQFINDEHSKKLKGLQFINGLMSLKAEIAKEINLKDDGNGIGLLEKAKIPTRITNFMQQAGI